MPESTILNLPDRLSATDAALYLGISTQRFWRHVREGLVQPCGEIEGGWAFSRSEMDKTLPSYYKKSTRYRNVAGLAYLAGAMLLIIPSSWFATRPLDPNEAARATFSIACSLAGVGVRALWLAPFPLPHPDKAYTIFYWLFAIVGGLAAFVAGSVSLDDSIQYLAGSGAIAFVIGFFIHPDFWPLGSWARSK